MCPRFVNRRGGPDADWHDKSLIHLILEGSYLSAYLHLSVESLFHDQRAGTLA
jgi:hypothetical protein